MGLCCCKSKEEELEFETDTQNNNGVTVAPQQEDIYKTRVPSMLGHQCNCPWYPCNRQENIFQTRPPCWYQHHCSCDCHQGGKCRFLLKSK